METAEETVVDTTSFCRHFAPLPYRLFSPSLSLKSYFSVAVKAVFPLLLSSSPPLNISIQEHEVRSFCSQYYAIPNHKLLQLIIFYVVEVWSILKFASSNAPLLITIQNSKFMYFTNALVSVMAINLACVNSKFSS